jgi:hypothetical protein
VYVYDGGGGGGGYGWGEVRVCRWVERWEEGERMTKLWVGWMLIVMKRRRERRRGWCIQFRCWEEEESPGGCCVCVCVCVCVCISRSKERQQEGRAWQYCGGGDAGGGVYWCLCVSIK